MFKRTSQRFLAVILAAMMLIGIIPLSVFAADGSVDNYDDFLANLKILETYAEEYAAAVGRDPGELVLNFIRTGVERYQDDNWTTLAGQEIVGFTSYVETQDFENGTTTMDLRDIVVDDFKLPNEDQVDFGHMFGCMNISYVASGSSDLSGWAGDLCDLLYYCVYDVSVPSNTVDEMAAYILENCFGEDADNAFGMDDFYGDMDAYYLISEFKKETASFSSLMEAYFTENLSDTDRAVYFVNNRFGVEDSKDAVRKAIYESYSADVGIKVLEAGRGLSSYNSLREACCYAFADYLYNLAQGQLIEGKGEDDTASNGYYTVFSNDHSVLAPGIEQDINYAQTADGKQIVYYIATVDVTRDDVTIMANYKDNDPSKGWGLQKVEDQVAALAANHKDKYENFNAIVSTNGDGYNITNGTPGGLLVMEGIEYYPVDKDGFFAVLKDGSAMIGTQDDYETYKDEIQEAIGGFGAVLIKDGKINVTKSANYTSQRASRTAIGIKEDGSVVMMVLDGRQLPFSAGGAMEEIAQIMLEAGCVEAINLDGGGSTTYLSKPAGSDEIKLVNRPSDGYARSVSVSLVAVSTAKSSNEFDHAIISSDYDYITAGTTLQFNVTGVSNTGNAAVIPEGAYWKVSDDSVGSIDENGLFTAVANGDVTIDFMIGDKSADSVTIHVVVPDALAMETTTMNAIYGEPATLPLIATYHGNRVAVKPSDFYVVLEHSNAGTVDGLSFTANEASGYRTFLAGAMLLANQNLIAYLQVNLYRSDESVFDFDNASYGNRKLAWNREIENAKTIDNQLYRISDPNSPVEIEYTFALDMTTIDIPAQLEPLKSMLPTYQENAAAWTYLLQLAERVCTQTNVTIRAEFSKDLAVDISGLKVVNDYFTLTNANLDENNVLTIVCNWVNQSKPIDAATANPLCILTGIKATVKDTAGYYNNEILIANNGNVSYDIYLAASSLYSFAQDTNNQASFALYPYVHEDDCRSDFSDADEEESTAANNDKGAHFSSQYMDFADIYVINNEIRQGWHEEGTDYYYYVDNVALTGVQLVTDRKDSTQKRFYEFDKTGKLVSEQGTTGLITFEGDLYYAVNGVAQTGWQQIGGNNYYFHPDTGKAVNGVYTIKEKQNPAVADGKYTPMVEYTYTFTDSVLTLGDWVYDTNIIGNDGNKHNGWRYRWAGDWKDGWFEVEGEQYFANKNYPNMIVTGYTRIMKQNAANSGDTQYHLFDENGVFQKDYTGIYYDGTNYAYLINGVRHIVAGLYEYNGYYYYINSTTGLVYVSQKDFAVNDNRANGLVPAGKYDIDEYGRLILPDIKVVSHEALASVYKVAGNRVAIVDKDTPACKVGYLENGKYVAVDAELGADGCYYFGVPAGIKEVQLVLAGDIDGDGDVDSADTAVLAQSLMPTGTALDGMKLIVADVNGNGKVNSADRTLIARSLLPTSHMLYKALEW